MLPGRRSRADAGQFGRGSRLTGSLALGAARAIRGGSSGRHTPVIIGVQTFVLGLPGCRSLKEKRMVVKSIKDRIRHRFNVSVAETGSQDVWTRAEVTVAAVCADRAMADAVLDRVDRFVEEDGRVVLSGVQRELF